MFKSKSQKFMFTKKSGMDKESEESTSDHEGLPEKMHKIMSKKKMKKMMKK